MFCTASSGVFARCLSDIYTAGISVDSFVYKIKRTRSDYATLGSESGTGLNIAKIQFCPDMKMEFTHAVRLRFFDFNLDAPEFSHLQKDNTLLSAGTLVRYFLNKKWEIIGEVAAGEELEFMLDAYRGHFYSDSYWNAKLAVGGRYYLKTSEKVDYALAAKIGALVPVGKTENIDTGQVLELDFDYFWRLGRTYSLRADLFYTYYSQHLKELEISRQEIGIRGNIFFRY